MGFYMKNAINSFVVYSLKFLDSSSDAFSLRRNVYLSAFYFYRGVVYAKSFLNNSTGIPCTQYFNEYNNIMFVYVD